MVVLVCSDTEWRMAKKILTPSDVSSSVFGELFEYKRILFFQTGWTKTAAAAGTQFVIDKYNPEQIINIGTCGGFAGHVEVGDILLVNKAVIYDLHERMGDPDEVLKKFTTNLDITHLSSEIKENVKNATIASADSDVDVVNVELLYKKFGAVAADWESGSIAYIATLNKQRLSILRGVTDVVSSANGEAYGNEDLFAERTEKAIRKLIDLVTKNP